MSCRLLLTFSLFITGFVMQGCETDNNNISGTIEGHWDVVSAERGGRPTTTLQEAYFEFLPENKAVINLDGNPQDAKFKLGGNSFTVSGTNMDTEYNIETLVGDSMVLSATIMNRDFVFRLKKSK
ncbi:MAG: hypothetical protein KDC24_12475 [Saprospiraceae bacterium]|nr:hypothetical protein [Saprospiraceae bacterium]